MSNGHLETYGGSDLPASSNWYWSPSERDCYNQSSSSRFPPSSDDANYTHTLLFAFRAHPLTGKTQLLLALKLRGFGAGTYNGIGGKLEPGESALSSVIRETHEEVGVEVTAEDVRFVGRVGINVPGEGGEVVRIAVYTTHSVCVKEVLRSEEVEARWYDVDASEGVVGWEGLPEKLRPEHWVYLGLLVGTHRRRSDEGRGGTLFDASVNFDPQPPKASLPQGERPENHRIVHSWSLIIFIPTPTT